MNRLLLIEFVVIAICILGEGLAYSQLLKNMFLGIKWVFVCFVLYVATIGRMKWFNTADNPLYMEYWCNFNFTNLRRFRLLGGMLWAILESEFGIFVESFGEDNRALTITLNEVVTKNKYSKRINAIKRLYAEAFYDFLIERQNDIPQCKNVSKQRIACWATMKAENIDMIAMTYFLYSKEKNTKSINDLIWEYNSSEMWKPDIA